MRHISVVILLAVGFARLGLLASLVAVSGCRSPQPSPTAPSPTAPEPPAENRYHVLFIAIDDLRPELGCYGADYVETPHIDALAARGVTFRQHFTLVPTCGASRFALLTGRSPIHSGVRAGNEVLYRGSSALKRERQPGAQSLPESFRRSGYRTALIGKISHTPDGRVFAYGGKGSGRDELPHAWDELATPFGPWKRGWGTFFAYANGAHREDGGGHRDLLQFTVEDDDELPDGLMATRAIETLETLAQNHAQSAAPFFLGLGFFKPHLPFVAPRRDWEAVADWPVPPPDHPARLDTAYWSRSGEFYGYRVPWKKTRPLAESDAMTARRGYLACVRYVDRQVGRVLQALDDLGLADRTVVVLWGDHGWFLGEGAMWGKHTPLELALRTPLIVSAPGTDRPGRTVDAVVSTLDLYPTLLDLCRPRFTTTEHPLDGKSLVPILSGEKERVHETVASYWQRNTSIRSSDYRLILKQGDDGWTARELYDLRPGADGLRNVASEQPEMVRKLEARVD